MLLELGRAWAGSVSRRTDIKRVTVYALLKSMSEKWRVTSFSENWISMYSVVSPEVLVQSKQQELQTFESALPAFQNITDSRWKKPKIDFYDWISGIKRLYEKHLHETTWEVWAFVSDTEIHDELEEFLNYDFIQRRKDKGIKAYVLVRDVLANDAYLEQTITDPLTDVKLIDEDLDWMKGEILMYGENKVSFALYGKDELVGYTIQSDQLYSTLKTMFNFIRKRL